MWSCKDCFLDRGHSVTLGLLFCPVYTQNLSTKGFLRDSDNLEVDGAKGTIVCLLLSFPLLSWRSHHCAISLLYHMPRWGAWQNSMRKLKAEIHEHQEPHLAIARCIAAGLFMWHLRCRSFLCRPRWHTGLWWVVPTQAQVGSSHPSIPGIISTPAAVSLLQSLCSNECPWNLAHYLLHLLPAFAAHHAKPTEHLAPFHVREFVVHFILSSN